jgi:hypothetical protein
LTYTDGNHATFAGTYDGTNPNGDLLLNVGGSFQLLTNVTYHIGDTIIKDAVPFVCFLRGTLIRTPKGDVAVETLQAGDLVMTKSGKSRPVKWIGHRDIDLRGRSDANSFYPVRIAAGAFGADRPSKELYLSAGHSICVYLCGEVLIPAGLLVNGSTITRAEMDDVSYWHVELETHDILVANNLPAESYLVMENRNFFVEAGGTLEALDKGLGRTHADFCRPSCWTDQCSRSSTNVWPSGRKRSAGRPRSRWTFVSLSTVRFDALWKRERRRCSCSLRAHEMSDFCRALSSRLRLARVIPASSASLCVDSRFGRARASDR